MKKSSDVIYSPCIRSGQYDLLALKEIEGSRRNLIRPIISAKGSSIRLISEFADQWSGSSFWIDSSRFPQDIQNPLSESLNDSDGNFSKKLEAFRQLKKINEKTLPVIGFRSGDKQRSVVQFGLKLYDDFEEVALRVEGTGEVLERNILTAKAILNAISDDELKRTHLIIDAWSINQMPSLQDGSSIQKSIQLQEEYSLLNVTTLSTSWPDDRPEKGSNALVTCFDPVWQAILHAKFKKNGVKCTYGDYAATNPMRDILDDYDPAKMAQPIPFAGYYKACTWHQERRGAGGENEKYREIAQVFRKLEGYHGDEFCWGTRAIKAIAMQEREKSGNMAFWNKIRINQHICAMTEDLANDLLEIIIRPQPDEEYDADYDLI